MAGVYVHVPFCHGKCAYCDFYSLPRRGATLPPELQHRFAQSLGSEYLVRRGELGGQPVRTLYFGGGTPSVLKPEILAEAVRSIPKDSLVELTLEVNPEDVTPSNASAWREIGVNRISMGVQSLVDAELKAVGRRHTAAQALAAVECLQAAGFGNISLDLIYGLPGQTAESFRRSVEGVIATGATHLSAYLLSYEPGTALTRRLERGLLQEADDATVTAMYQELCRLASEGGFEHYEISNFAKPGFRSRHNSSYWDLTPYLGLGPGAHSLGADGTRRFHLPDLDAYLADPEAVETDEEDEISRFNDLLIISLRRSEGLELRKVPPQLQEQLLRGARPYLERGELTLRQGTLKVPEEHWLITDAILKDLILC